MPLLRHRTRGVRLAAPSICALLFGAPSALADPPDGDLLFPFAGEDRIFVLEGEEDCENVMLDTVMVERCLSFDMQVDAKGRYEGTVSLSFEGNGIESLLEGVLKGSQKRRRGGHTKVDFRARRLRGEFDAPVLAPVRAAAKLRCKGEISPTGVLDALCAYVLKRPGRGSEGDETELPADVAGGDWDLALANLGTELNDRVVGNADDSLGFIYDVRGRYKEKKDESKLKLKGERGTRSKGAKVVLKGLETPGVGEASAVARYKLLGARGKTPVFSEEDE